MKYKIIIWGVLLVFGLSACSDFLEETSQDEVRPTTVDDLIQLMAGEVYPMNSYECPYLELLTDNAKCNGLQNQEQYRSMLENGRLIFSWDERMYEDLIGLQGMNSWAKFYTRIMGCNTVLEYLERVKGEQATKENVRGQALTMRAWSYFFLVNLHGLPYTVGDPRENPGVPLKLNMGVDDSYFTRASVFDVYEQIENDLLTGIKLMDENRLNVTLYKASPLMAKALLSRVYLYMGKWDEAAAYATEVLNEKPVLTVLAQGADWDYYTFTRLYDLDVSTEVLWIYESRETVNAFFSYGGYDHRPVFSMSDDLIDSFEEDDLRLISGHERGMDFTTYQTYYCFGYKGTATGKGSKGIRTGEVYLNRAEANIQKYMETRDNSYRTVALADLNTLRASRYNILEEVYVNIEERADIDVSTPESLYKFYQEERRRELDFEDHRWFDLRRMGMPRIEHKFFVDSENDAQVFVLEANSPWYVLPIPTEARDRNPYLQQNPR